VIFTGFSNDALSLINAMDVFILPSEKEGFSRVILEAMLMSKPVIAFDIAGVNEAVTDGITGILLKEEDGRSLAGAVVSLLNGGKRSAELGRAARQRVMEGFTIERYVREVTKVFEGALP
jgi:glycosyltransferase involved in cell wall biosynthesis